MCTGEDCGLSCFWMECSTYIFQVHLAHTTGQALCYLNERPLVLSTGAGGVQHAAHQPHVAQDSYEYSPIQNRKFS